MENRIILIGLDGGTFKVLGPLMEQGLMPNLKALKEKGSWGVLESTIPPFTIPAWASFITGRNPGKHGLVSWFGPTNDNHRKEFVNSTFIKGKTLWDILSESGKKIAVVNVPLTYPPRKVNGLMISGFLTPSLDSPFTYPPDLKESFPDYRIDLNYIVGQENIVSGPKCLPERMKLLRDIRGMTQKRGETCLKLLNQDKFDFFAVFFTGTDRLQHYFWDVIEDICEDNQCKKRSLLMDEVEDYFKNLDKVIGQLREVFGPYATTMIMSDHGFGPSPRKAFHALAFFKRRHVMLSLLRTVKNRKKEILYKTNPNISFVPLYCNYGGLLINREKKGRRYKALREQLIRQLKNVTDIDTHRRIVEAVWRQEEVYSGEYLSSMPDIIFCLNPNYVCGYSNKRSISQRDPGKETGDHEREGIIIVKGPIIKENSNIPTCSIMDVTLTVLYGLNTRIPLNMEGRVLTKIFDQDYLQRNPPEYHHDISPQESGKMSQGYTSEETKFVEERLKNLGYL